MYNPMAAERDQLSHVIGLLTEMAHRRIEAHRFASAAVLLRSLELLQIELQERAADARRAAAATGAFDRPHAPMPAPDRTFREKAMPNAGPRQGDLDATRQLRIDDGRGPTGDGDQDLAVLAEAVRASGGRRHTPDPGGMCTAACPPDCGRG